MSKRKTGRSFHSDVAAATFSDRHSKVFLSEGALPPFEPKGTHGFVPSLVGNLRPLLGDITWDMLADVKSMGSMLSSYFADQDFKQNFFTDYLNAVRTQNLAVLCISLISVAEENFEYVDLQIEGWNILTALDFSTNANVPELIEFVGRHNAHSGSAIS